MKKVFLVVILAAFCSTLSGCPFWDPFNKLGGTTQVRDGAGS